MNSEKISNTISLIVSIIVSYLLFKSFLNIIDVNVLFVIGYFFMMLLVGGFSYFVTKIFCMLLLTINIKPLIRFFKKFKRNP